MSVYDSFNGGASLNEFPVFEFFSLFIAPYSGCELIPLAVFISPVSTKAVDFYFTQVLLTGAEPFQDSFVLRRSQAVF
jgi:hypothetical protein